MDATLSPRQIELIVRLLKAYRPVSAPEDRSTIEDTLDALSAAGTRWLVGTGSVRDSSTC
jgi:hypothetical protein